MKKLLLVLLVLVAGYFVYNQFFKKSTPKPVEEKQQALENKKHSAEFNNSVNAVISSYMAMKESFVNGDTAVVKAKTNAFIAAIDGLKMDELQKDTAAIYEAAKGTVNDMKMNAQSILNQTDLQEMRKDFKMVTDMMYPGFFQQINYEGKKLYLQQCPMAFNDTEAANWLSDVEEIRNPYLGTNHPKYKATMLHCGEIKDSIQSK